LKFDIDAVELQTIGKSRKFVSGWKPAENRIIYSTTGYRTESEKSAIVQVNNNDGKFQLVDYITSQVAYTGKINKVKRILVILKPLILQISKRMGNI